MVYRQSIIIAFAMSFILASCNPDLKNAVNSNDLPPVFPLVDSVVIPSNIAPINIMPSLKIAEACSGVHICYTGNDGNSVVSYGKRATDIDIDDWHKLTNNNNEIVATVSMCINGQWTKYKQQHIFVSQDKIEPYVVYRKIAPGYETYGPLGIYQRSLETGEEHVLIDRTQTNGCMNCHSFAGHKKDHMSLHLRAGSHPGTLIKEGNKCHFINVPTEKLGGSYVYPSWHKDGRHIAFSTNNTQQIFHELDKKRIEVIDHWSNLEIVDTQTEEYVTNDILTNDSTFTTFPHFSPDGKWLYFCCAKAYDVRFYTKSLKYAIMRVRYDVETNTIGNEAEVIIDAPAMGKTATFPRISPDGKYMVFCLADYGQFTIWHPESDLYIMNLETREIKECKALNSNNVESYHSWSYDGKWLIFSSRRMDGQFTQPHIAHFDSETGEFGTPFAMPLARIRDYFEEYYSYNVPEFVLDEISEREIQL